MKLFLGIIGGLLGIRGIAYLAWTDEQRKQYRRDVKRKGGFPWAI